MSAKNLKQLRKFLELTQAELGRSIGLSDSQINRLELAKSALSEQIIFSLAYKYNVNPTWWTDDSAPMFLDNREPEIQLSAEEKTLVEKLRTLSKREREKALAVFKTLLGEK